MGGPGSVRAQRTRAAVPRQPSHARAPALGAAGTVDRYRSLPPHRSGPGRGPKPAGVPSEPQRRASRRLARASPAGSTAPHYARAGGRLPCARAPGRGREGAGVGRPTPPTPAAGSRRAAAAHSRVQATNLHLREGARVGLDDHGAGWGCGARRKLRVAAGGVFFRLVKTPRQSVIAQKPPRPPAPPRRRPPRRRCRRRRQPRRRTRPAAAPPRVEAAPPPLPPLPPPPAPAPP